MRKVFTSAPAIQLGLMAPLAILFVLLFWQAQVIAQVVDEKHLVFVLELESKGWMTSDTVITFNPNTYEETMKIVHNNVGPEVDGTGKLVYQYTEVQPQFPGGQEALNTYLKDHLKYPAAAKQAGAEGGATVGFIVNQDGQISNVRAVISSGFNMREDMLEESERVVLSMPYWIPAKHKGKAVSCKMNVLLNFKLDSKSVEATSFPIADGKTTLMDPLFPGNLNKFLLANIKYPKAAKAAKVEGIVIVKFVVKEDGSLTEIKQANSDNLLHPDLVKEAIRVVKAMPKWKPGMKEGKVIQMEYTLPIKFKLDK